MIAIFPEITDDEEVYQLFRLHIEKINNLITTYNDVVLGHVQVSSGEGAILFFLVLFGCAFRLKNFAKMYSSRFTVDVTKMIDRLYGEFL